jgi:hypothetical protein
VTLLQVELWGSLALNPVSKALPNTENVGFNVDCLPQTGVVEDPAARMTLNIMCSSLVHLPPSFSISVRGIPGGTTFSFVVYDGL